jgi:hypothetical protein
MKIFLTLTLFIQLLLANPLNIEGGEVIGKNIYGLLTDYKGDPLQVEGKSQIQKESSYNGFLSIKDTEDEIEQEFLISSFYNDSKIGAIYVTKTKLLENSIQAFDTEAIDLSPQGGVYGPSKAVKTDWNTYIFMQTALIDSKQPEAFEKAFKPYFKNKGDLIDSYNYGWNFETVVLNIQGHAKAINNFAMGRTFSDTVKIMPDAKTVYLYDSQYSNNLYLFVASTPEDFSKGSLYVAKKVAKKIKWIKLGKNSAIRIKLKLKKKLEFGAIFKSKKPKNGDCAKGFSSIQTVYGHECLKVNSRFTKYAGAFEPIRYAAIKGAIPFIKNVSLISHNTDSKILEFKHNDSVQYQYQLTTDTTIGSEYIIK